MDEPRPVYGGQCVGQLLGHAQALFIGERTLLKHLGEGAPIEVLHRDVAGAIEVPELLATQGREVVDHAHVRVDQRARVLGFAGEALDGRRIDLDVGPQDLERNVALKLKVPRSEDLRVRALTESIHLGIKLVAIVLAKLHGVGPGCEASGAHHPSDCGAIAPFAVRIAFAAGRNWNDGRPRLPSPHGDSSSKYRGPDLLRGRLPPPWGRSQQEP